MSALLEYGDQIAPLRIWAEAFREDWPLDSSTKIFISLSTVTSKRLAVRKTLRTLKAFLEEVDVMLWNHCFDVVAGNHRELTDEDFHLQTGINPQSCNSYELVLEFALSSPSELAGTELFQTIKDTLELEVDREIGWWQIDIAEAMREMGYDLGGLYIKRMVTVGVICGVPVGPFYSRVELR